MNQSKLINKIELPDKNQQIQVATCCNIPIIVIPLRICCKNSNQKSITSTRNHTKKSIKMIYQIIELLREKKKFIYMRYLLFIIYCCQATCREYQPLIASMLSYWSEEKGEYTRYF